MESPRLNFASHCIRTLFFEFSDVEAHPGKVIRTIPIFSLCGKSKVVKIADLSQDLQQTIPSYKYFMVNFCFVYI